MVLGGCWSFLLLVITSFSSVYQYTRVRLVLRGGCSLCYNDYVVISC